MTSSGMFNLIFIRSRLFSASQAPAERFTIYIYLNSIAVTVVESLDHAKNGTFY